MAALLSDAEVGFGAKAALPRLLSDAEVGFKSSAASPPAAQPSPATGDYNFDAPVAAGEAPDTAAIKAAAQIPTDVAGGLTRAAGDVVATGGTALQSAASNAATFARQQAAVMDQVDAGKKVAPMDDPLGYADAAPDQRADIRARMERALAEAPAPADTALGQAGAAVKSVGEDIRGAGSAIQGAGEAAFPLTPEEQQQFSVKTVKAVGTLVKYIGAAAVGGLPAAIGLAGMDGFGSGYDAAKSAGASDSAAATRGLLEGLASAGMMTVPIGRAMNAVAAVPEAFRGFFLRGLAESAKSGVALTAFGQIQKIADNAVAKATTDPERPLTEGVGQDMGPAFVAGMVAPGIVAGGKAAADHVRDVLGAGSVDDAVAAASRAAAAPTEAAAPVSALAQEVAKLRVQPSSAPPTNAPAFIPPGASVPVLPRILDLIGADNAVAAGRPDFIPPSEPQPANPLATPQPRTVPPIEVTDAAAQPEPASVGAAASREQTPLEQIAPPADEAAANRLQGEVERLATPPRPNDRTIYIPGTKPTLAEVTGDPRVAMDQAYNRQQPEAMQAHTEQENHNADLVADYYADTAGSTQTLARMERARDERAQQNIQRVFGSPDSTRAPADPTPVVAFMQESLDDPRLSERDVIQKTIPKLIDRFYSDDGSPKTDPLSLYGIRQHIQDLLNGAGDPETNAAARTLRRELMGIQERLDEAIEKAAPGFAQYRANYTADSRAIDAMKLLQGERLSLLNKDLHITPAKWFSFMRGIVEGRADPMDPASALSEEQMDRLWDITDQLKRQTFIDAGRPRGSWTSMMQEWGGRFARVAAHGLAAAHFPVMGNLGIEMGVAQLRRRSVSKEMNRLLNPAPAAP